MVATTHNVQKWLEPLFSSAVVFLAVYLFSMQAIGHARQDGVLPAFYQAYYEPAVRIACGQGFGVDSAGKLSQEFKDFLRLKRDSLRPESVPPAEKFDPYPNTRIWYHLFWTVGTIWKFTGISWGVMDHLAALLLAAAGVGVLALFRLWTPWMLAVPLAVLSSLPGLAYLLSFRDVNKAPFIVAVLYAGALTVSRELSRTKLLVLAACVGIVVGVGYGFRPDVLVGLPFVASALLFFRPSPWRRRLAEGAVAVAVMLATFGAAVSPVLSAYRKEVGSCSWHFAMLGLSDSHNMQLAQADAGYSWLTNYDDDLLANTVDSYAKRNMGAVEPVGYCTRAYDKASVRLYADILTTFPADFLRRMVATAKQVLSVGLWAQPRSFFTTPFGTFLQLNRNVLQNVVQISWIATLFILLAWNLRVGLFALFSLLYLSTYPVIQIDVRHYFHLAPLTWLLPGLFFAALSREVAARKAGVAGPFSGLRWRGLLHSGAVLAGVAGLVFVLYAGFSSRQETNMQAILARYAAAHHDSFQLLPAPEPPAMAPSPAPQPAEPMVRLVVDSPFGHLPQLSDQMLRLDFAPDQGKAGPVEFTASLCPAAGQPGLKKSFSFTLGAGLPNAVVFLPVYFKAPRFVTLELTMPAALHGRLVSASWVRPKELPGLWLALAAYSENGKLLLAQGNTH